uniref:Uncharacterized protein MANES_16G044800 n=1 Tax=Rhizophora mucronata TaxID=61149 RepID=A0A2P2KD68_RHIMU
MFHCYYIYGLFSFTYSSNSGLLLLLLLTYVGNMVENFGMTMVSSLFFLGFKRNRCWLLNWQAGCEKQRCDFGI